MDNVIGASIHIEGHFFEELTSTQTGALLPGIDESYQAGGVVNYSHADGRTSVFDVEAEIFAGERRVRVTIAPDEVLKCYILEGEPVLSVIQDVEIEAGIYITDKNGKGERSCIYYADFKLGDAAYYVEYAGEETDSDFFSGIVASLISGGGADLSVLDNPAVPELREEELTETDAYAEADFGAYLPEVPKGYQFNRAVRLMNQNRDELYASWSQGYHDITVIISRLSEKDKERIVAEEDTELYDMSLYPIPWAESMPRETREIIENPIFRGENLTLDILKRRGYTRNEQGESGGSNVNMRFSVLYDTILVEISTEGVSPEYLFEALTVLQQR